MEIGEPIQIANTELVHIPKYIRVGMGAGSVCVRGEKRKLSCAMKNSIFILHIHEIQSMQRTYSPGNVVTALWKQELTR